MGPVLLHSGEGETIAEREERSVVIKGESEQVAVTESRYAVGERGPEAHIHLRHTDAFYVLEGALVFELGGDGDVVRAEAGSLGLVPSGVVHTFGNEGPGEARFLNVHAPSEGFADYLRAMRDGRRDDAQEFDTFDPPVDGGRPASEALVRGPDEGETIEAGPTRATLKAEGNDGEGTLSLSEAVLAPGFLGPVPHFHETFVDSFYVLAGTLTVRLEDETVTAPAGSFALVPPGVVHTFSNRSDEPVRALNLMAPGGFEQYLKEVAHATQGGPPDPQLMAQIASKYDFHPVG